MSEIIQRLTEQTEDWKGQEHQVTRHPDVINTITKTDKEERLSTICKMQEEHRKEVELELGERPYSEASTIGCTRRCKETGPFNRPNNIEK